MPTETFAPSNHDAKLARCPASSSFFGIVIEMYFGVIIHRPISMPATAAKSAKIEIATGAVLAGSLSSRALRLVREWVEQHRDELEANWESRQQRQASTNRATEMSEIISITNVEPLDGFWIRASFSDGAVKEIDLSELIGRGNVFAPIRDHREVFNQVHVNPDTHTIEWPGEVDLDPEVLYGRFEPASGARVVRRTIQEPAHATG